MEGWRGGASSVNQAEDCVGKLRNGEVRYPLCNYRVVNPGLDAAQFDSFDSDDEATDPIEDEHHALCLLWLCVCQTAFSGSL